MLYYDHKLDYTHRVGWPLGALVWKSLKSWVTSIWRRMRDLIFKKCILRRFYTKEMDPFVRFFAFYLQIPLVDFFAVFEKTFKKLGTVNQ